MQTQRLWLQVTAFLLLVWAGVAAVMWLTEDYVFTPEKTLALMSESPWYENERLGHEQRMQHLDKVITSVVKLDFSQRARMREDGEETIDRFMKSLTDEEKGEYIGRVVEEHFQAVMKGIDKLPADDRRGGSGFLWCHASSTCLVCEARNIPPNSGPGAPAAARIAAVPAWCGEGVER